MKEPLLFSLLILHQVEQDQLDYHLLLIGRETYSPLLSLEASKLLIVIVMYMFMNYRFQRMSTTIKSPQKTAPEKVERQ